MSPVFAKFTDISQLGVMLVISCALLMWPNSARSATLSVQDLWVSYTSQTATSAVGTVHFNLSFDSLAGNPTGGFDTFSSLVTINKVLGNSSAQFILDEFQTEDTSSLGASYWLTSPTGHEDAITQAGDFRFFDYISFTQFETLSPGDIVAHLIIDFNLTSSDQFGDYVIQASGQTDRFGRGFNYFLSDLVNRFDNTITPATFTLVAPEPAAGCLLAIGGILVLVHRRRRHHHQS